MINSLILLVGIIINVALLTASERKIMGALQRRVGPNTVGTFGLLQPFADGIKLIFKETVIPLNANSSLFLSAPYFFFYLALLNWFIIPLETGISITELIGGGILIIVAISELSIYGVLFSGWSSNSKYSLLGSLRSTAQMISYSLNLSIILLIVIFTLGTINLFEILDRQSSLYLIWPLLPFGFLFILCAIFEANRAPADLPEAESELVSGFMTEYSGVAFAFFFLAEYSNMLFLSSFFFLLFCGFGALSFQLPFLFLFIWLRASLPRIRFDQLIHLGWIHLLPFTITFLLLLPIFIFTFSPLFLCS